MPGAPGGTAIKVRLRAGFVVAALFAAAVVAGPTTSRASVPPGFVYAQGNRLMADGQPWRAIGVNLWDMDAIKVAQSDLAGCYYTHADLDSYFDSSFQKISQAMHATAVRSFGFREFYTGGGADWGSVDKLLYYAQKWNVRVIPQFGDQWPGCAQPLKDVSWYMCSTPGCTPGYKKPGPYGISYRDYVGQAVERYAANPTIAFWQLMNEATSKDSNGSYTAEALASFSRDMVSVIRSSDPYHLINTGVKGGPDVPRPYFGQLLAGDSSACSGIGAEACDDIAAAHDYSSAVPMHGIPMTSEARGYVEVLDASGGVLVSSGPKLQIDSEKTADGQDWLKISSWIPAGATSWRLRFTSLPGTGLTVHVDDVLVRMGPLLDLYTFESGEDGFAPENPATATTTRSERHARAGTGSLKIDLPVTAALSGAGVIVSPPPMPPRTTSDNDITVWARANFTAPIKASGYEWDTIAADLHDATVDYGKPFVLTEIALPAEVPFSNPAFQVPNPYVPSCPQTARTAGDRGLAYQKMMAVQLDEEHMSSGFVPWDWKDPSSLSTAPNGTLVTDPNISCFSITPGDPAESVIRSWADQTPNTLPAPAPLGTYSPSMFVVQGPPASATQRATLTLKARLVRDGGDAYPGIVIAATGACTGSGTTDATGYVSFTCMVTNTTGSQTITIAPGCGDCPGIARQYLIEVTPLGSLSAPTVLRTYSGYQPGQITILWDKPTYDGGSPVIEYKIYAGSASGGQTYVATVPSPSAGTISYVEGGLGTGEVRYYKVSAVNATGEGPLTNEVMGKAPVQPQAPRDLLAQPALLPPYTTLHGVELTWSAPAFHGGTAITEYKVYRRLAEETTAVLVRTQGTGRVWVDTGCAPGMRCVWSVAAVNGVGEGPRSEEATFVGW